VTQETDAAALIANARRYSEAPSTVDALAAELIDTKAEIARLRTALLEARAVVEDNDVLFAIDRALTPDTGELVDYVEFTDGTSLMGEEATAFFKSNTGEEP